MSQNTTVIKLCLNIMALPAEQIRTVGTGSVGAGHVMTRGCGAGFGMTEDGKPPQALFGYSDWTTVRKRCFKIFIFNRFLCFT